MFKFEIINGLTHKYLFDKSIEILINKFTNIKDELDNTQDYNKIESILLFAENCFDITILNEDDTIGNIFQSYIHNEYIRKKDKKIYDGLNKCIFAGYINIHPLQNKIKLRLTLEGVEKDKLETTLKKFISIICEEIIYLLLQIQKNWNNSIDLFLNL
jgi:DNA-directed RNA polymerase subunit L